jgi:hypothetical protein
VGTILLKKRVEKTSTLLSIPSLKKEKTENIVEIDMWQRCLPEGFLFLLLFSFVFNSYFFL